MSGFSIFLIILGLLFAWLAWVLHRLHQDIKHAILDLAEHGPCTGLELRRRSAYKYLTLYGALHDAQEHGLVFVSYRPNSTRTVVIRGQLKTPVFRLSTSGWQAATRLRAGGSLYEDA